MVLYIIKTDRLNNIRNILMIDDNRTSALLFSYPISNRYVDQDVEYAHELIKSGSNGHYMACANPHSLVVASRDKAFSTALKQADILLPDGEGILLASRVLNLTIKQRVTGSDFFCRLTKKLSEGERTRYFFLGSTNQVLTLITDRMRTKFPNIIVCGTLSPPFREGFNDYENFSMVSAVNAARPDVLWVGMTAPKQEKWIYKNRDELQVPFIGAIGAAFDFFAGTKKRSSKFCQNIGIEWLTRFLREPKRLWERNLKSTPIFLYWIIKEWIEITIRS